MTDVLEGVATVRGETYRGRRGVSPDHWGPQLSATDSTGSTRYWYCFEWGYGGTGPGELAQFILARHLGVRQGEVPRAQWMAFKFDVLAGLPRDRDWMLTSSDLDAWLKDGRVPSQYRGIGHGPVRLRGDVCPERLRRRTA
jgi:hypothetical protein